MGIGDRKCKLDCYVILAMLRNADRQDLKTIQRKSPRHQDRCVTVCATRHSRVSQSVSGHCQDDDETLFEAYEGPQEEVRGGEGRRQRWA